MDLSNFKVLVTGGAGLGVGRGVCEALSGCGATLVINDLDEAKLEKAVSLYPKAFPVVADLKEESSVAAMFDKIKKEVGVINGLVNNAGIGLSKLAHQVSTAEFDHLYGVDVKAVWMVSKYFVNQLLPSKAGGSIVNISSVHAHSTQPKYAIYCSAKSAVQGLTKGMAYELGAKYVRVNAVAPGLVHSEQNYDLMKTFTDDPIKWQEDFIKNQQVIPRFIEAIDCGNTVAFLISDLSKSITGQTIVVDAGTTIMIMNRDFVEK